MKNKVAVLGGGSLGLLLAGKLSGSGRECAVWTRTREQARKLNEEGLTVEDGAEPPKRLTVSAIPWEDADPFVGIVMLAVKQKALTGGFLKRLAEIVPEGGTVVPFQNGVGHVEALRGALPGRTLVVAVTTEGALRLNDTHVRRTGKGDIRLGDDGQTAFERLKAVERVLSQAGFSVFLSNHLEEDMMRKLLVNAVINPLTAILRVPNGAIAGSPERLGLAHSLFRETYGVLGAYGLEDESGLWETVLRVCEATAVNRSSMLQDVDAGKETEIESINGMIVRMAAAKGMDAPWNRAMTAIVKAIRK